MSLLKEFLAQENKSMDDIIKEPSQALGIIQMDSSSFRWLEKQDKMQKLDMFGLIDIRSYFSPWLFNQVIFLFLGMGFGDVEDNITAYYREGEVIFFTIDTSGFYVLLAPLQDLSVDTHERRIQE